MSSLKMIFSHISDARLLETVLTGLQICRTVMSRYKDMGYFLNPKMHMIQRNLTNFDPEQRGRKYNQKFHQQLNSMEKDIKEKITYIKHQMSKFI
jgi:benzoyl-CoA reductase/2-hydroxyglutaryl-CoA dehydratase subunit BcrC/BadD/HgdB